MAIKAMAKWYIDILKLNTTEKASLEFRSRKTDDTRNYLLYEIKHNDLISEKYKETCKYLNYVEHFLILASLGSGCVAISAFASLVVIPLGMRSSAVGIEICVITAWMKKYKSIINNNKKHNKVASIGKNKLNTIKILISKALIDSYIGQDEFASINKGFSEYNEMKKEIKNPETFVEYFI